MKKLPTRAALCWDEHDKKNPYKWYAITDQKLDQTKITQKYKDQNRIRIKWYNFAG